MGPFGYSLPHLRLQVLQSLRDLRLVLTADMHFPRLGSDMLSTEDGRNAP